LIIKITGESNDSKYINCLQFGFYSVLILVCP